MAERFQLYHCNICGQVVKVVKSGAHMLICCGEEMDKIETDNEGKIMKWLNKIRSMSA